MHPIEQLRYVARANGADAAMLVGDSVDALRALGMDRTGLVIAARRMLQHHPTCGPLWWMFARLLSAVDPRPEAGRVDAEISADTTPDRLAEALPDDATVVVAGSAPTLVRALGRRGDVRVIALDAGDAGWSVARRLERLDIDVTVIPTASVGPAVSAADVTLFESDLIGPERALAPIGSLALAAVASASGRDVWAIGGVGRRVPPAIADRVMAAAGDHASALERDDDLNALGARWSVEIHDVVALSLVSSVVGPDGRAEPGDASPDFEAIPELLRALES